MRGIRDSSWAAVAACCVLALAFGTACATRDKTSINEARAHLQAATDSGKVAADSIDMREAERRIIAAEQEYQRNGDQSFIDHEATMAGMYAKVALTNGEAQELSGKASAYVDRARVQTAVTRGAVERAIRNAEALDAKQTVRGLVLTLGGVLFAFDSAELKPEAQLAISRVAGFLIALDDREVVVEGFTDNVGEPEYNVGLSKKRAESVRDALAKSGVGEARIAAGGYGPAFPVASNDTEEGRGRNRRVEVVILKSGESAAKALR